MRITVVLSVLGLLVLRGDHRFASAGPVPQNNNVMVEAFEKMLSVLETRSMKEEDEPGPGDVDGPSEPADESNTDPSLFEGDIKLTAEQEAAINEAIKSEEQKEHGGQPGTQANSWKSATTWPKGIVYYRLTGRTTESTWRTPIMAAMRHIEANTCIRFKQALSSQSRYLRFMVGRGCYSYIGMQNTQGQDLSIGIGCYKIGTVTHELIHALGAMHEQSRPDRDNYIRVLTQNIRDGTESQFRKYSTSYIDNLNVPYDLTSIMHYHAKAFSKNGQNTIETKDASKQRFIGQRDAMSSFNILLLNRLYKCNNGGGSGSCGECKDQSTHCDVYKRNNFCGRPSLKQFMATYCRKTCDLCNENTGGSGSCTDLISGCPAWVAVGICNYKLGEQFCPKSCKTCTTD